MKVGKPQSKRVPVRLRHKIQKASSAKQKKQRKEAKKNPQWRSRLKKDPGIPNLFPFKAQMLAELEEKKRMKEEEQLRKREVARAQREGRAVTETQQNGVAKAAEDDDDVLIDQSASDENVDAMDEQEDSNPMAALLASAQARAKAYDPEDEDDDENESENDDEWDGIDEKSTTVTSTQPSRKALPKQALADPIKAVSALLERLQKTTDGIQQLIDYYQTPPLMTGGKDAAPGFLVEVARKRGRLGRGGVPNLHSAALIVLGDVNEERLVLPAMTSGEVKKSVVASTGEVTIVSKMAEPFRLEGLWEEDADGEGEGVAASEMAVEA